ncbi:MAG: TRAP transporter small permease subunit [Alphaproteobacteria bacterium]|nr:TRAP transporter small permease subunit [Alphaproteobacteria bacterium]MBU0797738.1 TRAP transporter small permease subunit [Alphaproteobacteria bacterium]MBU0887101.1 TRAP transporter small permease subunit [Alphaproteobacteria bacterium]MBU1814351.1 TRAP transporter small permease subunit [Alphaproteobacteria bacterium]
MTYIIGRISGVFGAVAALASLALILVIVFEVTSRYVLHAPTVWAFDVAYMLNGAIFVFAAALTLRLNQHVSVDIFSKAIPEKVFRAMEIVVYLLLILPAISLLTYAGWSEFFKSWATGEVETVSPWQPKIWPFRFVLAIGLTALWLQVLARIFAPAENTTQY